MSNNDPKDQDTPPPAAPTGAADNLEAALSQAFDAVVPPPAEGNPFDRDRDERDERDERDDRDEDDRDAARASDDDVDDRDDDGGDDRGDDGDDEEGDDEARGPDAMPGEDGMAVADDADPEEAARLAALSADLDTEPADESPEGEIPLERMDEDALKVVRRLHHFGYEAYLVGGCVRDLLLGRKPKDFDVSTSADPNQIRQIFRNCRLIGRRFRLAHVYFHGGKVIETSTFRANPLDEMDDLPQDLLISQDNVFGTSEQDARRRDFTVNALFYDPKTGKVVDHVGGRADLDARLIRTIGDPDVRLREDPVRILRAVKFASRLGFGIDPLTREAMSRHATEIARCAAPRVLEEIYRLLSSGAAREAFQLLMELGIFPVLLPEIAPALGFNADGSPPSEDALLLRNEVLDALGALDAIKTRGVEPSHALSLGALLLRLYLRASRDGQDPNRWLDDLSAAMVNRLRLTRRDRERVRLLLQTQRHLAPDRRRGGAARTTIRRGPFLEALLLYTTHLYATGGDLAEIGQWKALARAEGMAWRPGEVVDKPGRDEGFGGGGRGDRGGRGGGRGGPSGGGGGGGGGSGGDPGRGGGNRRRRRRRRR